MNVAHLPKRGHHVGQHVRVVLPRFTLKNDLSHPLPRAETAERDTTRVAFGFEIIVDAASAVGGKMFACLACFFVMGKSMAGIERQGDAAQGRTLVAIRGQVDRFDVATQPLWRNWLGTSLPGRAIGQRPRRV